MAYIWTKETVLHKGKKAIMFQDIVKSNLTLYYFLSLLSGSADDCSDAVFQPYSLLKLNGTNSDIIAAN